MSHASAPSTVGGAHGWSTCDASTATGRGNGITTISVAPADQSYRRDVAQPAGASSPTYGSNRIVSASARSRKPPGAYRWCGLCSGGFSGGGAGRPGCAASSRRGPGQPTAGPSMREGSVSAGNCLAGGLGRSRGIQPGRSVEESVDDVCIYTAHLCAAWG